MASYPDITIPGDRTAFGEKLEAFTKQYVNLTNGEFLDTVLTGSRGVAVHDKGGQVYDIRAYGAACDGVTDDRLVFQQVVDLCGANGGGIVTWNGICVFNSATQGIAGGNPACIVISHDNVTIRGKGAASVLKNTAPDIDGVKVASFFISGSSKAARTAEGSTTNWFNYALTGNTGVNPPIYNLTGVYDKGVTQITLANAGDAANFVVGDWILIRTGQTLDGFSGQPYGELNRIAGISGANLILEFPTARRYAQHYYISGTTGRTSEAVTANPAPYGVSKGTNLLIRNITLADFAVDSQTGAPVVIGGFAVNPRWERITGSVKGWGLESFGCHRGHIVQECEIHSYDLTEWAYVVSVDAACTEGKFLNNIFTSEDHAVSVHIHEGAAGTEVSGNTIRCPDVAFDENLVSIRAGASDTVVTHNNLYGGGLYSQVFVDATCQGGVISENYHYSRVNPVNGVTIAASATGFVLGPSRYEGAVGGYFVEDPLTVVTPDPHIIVPAAVLQPIYGSTANIEQINNTTHLGRPLPNAVTTSLGLTTPIPADWRVVYVYLQIVNKGAVSGDVVLTTQGERFAAGGTIDGGTAISTGNTVAIAATQWSTTAALVHTVNGLTVDGGGELALVMNRLGADASDTLDADISVEFVRIARRQ